MVLKMRAVRVDESNVKQRKIQRIVRLARWWKLVPLLLRCEGLLDSKVKLKN